MATVPLVERVAAISVDRGLGAPGGRYSYGSGCLIGGNTVLTAAHVVAGAHQVWVRTAGWAEHPATVDPGFVGEPGGWDPDRPAAPDLALLTLTDAVAVPRMPLARLDRTHPAGLVERVRSIGYPWFGERDTPADEAVRVQAPVAGQVLLSGREDGLLDFQVTIAPPRPEGAGVGSQWSGMSGAPVTAGGRLIGVVTEHAPRKGDSTVAVIPLTALNRDPDHSSWGAGVGVPAAWWARLGIQDPSGLAVLPQGREAPYRATLREFGHALHQRMHRLLGREAELADVAGFATGNQEYRWLVGGAYAGKSALLFEAVTSGALPDSVDVVAYFLSRRASDATADKFLNAVVPQLEVLLEWEHQTPDRNRFHQAWQEATSRARRDGRHVLLVVDAIDEDLHPAGSPTVTSLLPTLVGANGHVLVSSRPYPQIHARLPGTHPLATCPRIDLAPFEGAAEMAEQAKGEIDTLARSGREERRLLGLLTAAAGPLSAADFAALMAHPGDPDADIRHAVRSVLTGEGTARSLEPVGSLDAPRYQFAHDLLAEHARANPDLADREYRDRIHAWADTWAQAGWPDPRPDGTGTPRYLLDTYPTTLFGDPHHPHLLPPEPARLTALASDVGWVDTAIRTIGVDATRVVLREAAIGGDRRVADLDATVGARAESLRPPHPVEQPGHVLRALCLQAREYGLTGIGGDMLTRLAARSGELLPVWTTTQSTPPALELGTHDNWVRAVAGTADGHVATGGDDHRVLLWDPRRPGDPVELGTHAGAVRAVAVTADGHVVTGGDDHRVLLWDPRGPGDPVELGTHTARVNAMAVTADGHVVTGGDDHRVLLWDPHHPGTRTELGSHARAVRAVAVTGDGRVVTGGADHRVLLWDRHHPGTPLELGSHDNSVRAVAVTGDGRVVTGGADHRVLLWDPARPGTPVQLGTHDGWVRAATVASDGHVVTGGDDRRVLQWDPRSPGDPVELGAHASAVRAVAITSDGYVVTGGADRRLRLWSRYQSHRRAKVGTRRRGFSAVAVAGDGRVVTGGAGHEVLLWNPHGPDEPVKLGTHNGWVAAIAVTGDGRVVTGGGDHRVRLWDPHLPGTPRELGAHRRAVRAVALTLDGRVVTGGDDDRVLLWDPDHPGTPLELGTHDDSVRAVAVTGDGDVVTGGGDHRVRLWDPHHPGTPLELGTHRASVNAVAVTLDGHVVTGGDDHRVLLWDPHHPGTPLELGTHDGTVRAVAVIADGRVVTGGADHQVLLWDTQDPGHPSLRIYARVNAVTPWTSPTGQTHYVAMAGRGATLWKIASTPTPRRTPV